MLTVVVTFLGTLNLVSLSLRSKPRLSRYDSLCLAQERDGSARFFRRDELLRKFWDNLCGMASKVSVSNRGLCCRLYRSSPPPPPPAPPCVRSVRRRCPSAHPAWASPWTAAAAAKFAPGSWTRTAAWPSLVTTLKGWSVTLGPALLLLLLVASAEVCTKSPSSSRCACFWPSQVVFSL